ncbi:VWA domain-containing protein [Acidobacteria bacterium AH-259-O06]|nr:VWA domain-containing protein [Acidobacteria bacterium AH-259-O06]
MKNSRSDPCSSMEDQGHLLRNMILFARLLRDLGMNVTTTRIIDLVEAAKHVNIGYRKDFRDAVQTILVSRREHLALFHRVFDLFWQAGEKRGSSPELGLLLRRSHQIKEQPALQTHAEDHQLQQVSAFDPREAAKIRTYSAQEVLRQKDFAELTPAEREEVKRLMQDMTWEVEQHRTRRTIQGSRGAYLDMRRTLRHNLRQGGEPLLLRWRRRKHRRRPLVVICDISGSMEPYSRLLLQFIFVINSRLQKMEAFVFGTRLMRITRHLKVRDVDQALSQVTGAIQDWAGGTRIGEALKNFNYDWARRVLSQGAIVLIISDGWDRGNIQLLEKEMARLQRSCRRLIWLNPLLGSPRYEPLTRGIRTALPYIDDFLPVHNLTSLEQLGKLLERLGEHRPLRRQMRMRFSEVA